MNNCVLMAEIIQEPQLRYTADNLAVTEMLVQFPNSQRAEDSPATLKVVGWGNLATEIEQKYHQGDRVILVGRLGMNTIERPEGFKEKRAELTVQQIQAVGGSFSTDPLPTMNPQATETTPRQPSSEVASSPKNAPNYEDSPRPAATPATNNTSVIPPAPTPETTNYPQPTPEDPSMDDIPF
ncbi:MAG: single-stranded DNA-binding protein [Desmonostoc vinosum HA7617-LM4]|nr:single-stranded DNA-binding protein [Desmonostoc vinosum HA7617-LM4]